MRPAGQRAAPSALLFDNSTAALAGKPGKHKRTSCLFIYLFIYCMQPQRAWAVRRPTEKVRLGCRSLVKAECVFPVDQFSCCSCLGAVSPPLYIHITNVYQEKYSRTQKGAISCSRAVIQAGGIEAWTSLKGGGGVMSFLLVTVHVTLLRSVLLIPAKETGILQPDSPPKKTIGRIHRLRLSGGVVLAPVCRVHS